jgi:tetratricopeptide (TPR) repeat protein
MLRFTWSIIALLILAGAVRAVDAVAFLDERKSQVRGTIVGLGKDQVIVQDTSTGESSKIPATTISHIIWDKEPAPLKTARTALRKDNDATKCQAELAKIDAGETLREEVKMEVQFYKAIAKVKLATAGRERIATAGSEMVAFLKAYPDNYHFYEATEAIGDIYRARGDHAKAIESYNKLSANATYKLRAGLGTGWTLIDQNKAADAQKAFDGVITAATASENAEIKTLAMLGKAAALGLQDKTDEAIKAVNDIISKADPEQRAVHARAYNVLGGILKKMSTADKKNAKQALLAYLHIDILYAQDAAEHSEALGNLVALYREVGNPQRANDAAARLKREYPASRWVEGQ